MKRGAKIIAVHCAACDAKHGEFTEKDSPKSFACTACGLGQQVSAGPKVGFSSKRNYPQGFFENQ